MLLPMSNGDSRGFSLLETLVGGVVLSVVLLGVSSVWVQHQRAFRQARNRMIADFLLQSEMEQVVAAGFYGLPDLAAAPPSIVDVKRQSASGLSTTKYETDVAFIPNTDDSLRKAVVTVSYPDKGGQTATLSAETDLFWTQ
jgi:type II secretory pathway pseudopilin PulG